MSKHLRVLREVGVVDVREEGRQRLYVLNRQALKPIHDWVSTYERFWIERLGALDAVLDDLKGEQHAADAHEGADAHEAADAQGAEGERGP